MHLGLDDDELTSCVACGLCLPHCPTFVITGRDTESPRGRIALMQAVQNEGAPVTGEVLRSMETCVQCLGCETACPSGVPFGHLMEGTRAALAAEGRITPWWQRLGLRLLRHRRLLLAGSSLLALAGGLRLLPMRRLGLPTRLPLRRGRHRASGSDVWLFTGCVMDAWQRHTHLAVQRVLEAAGVGVTPTAGAAPCCGALHAHAGLEPDAAAMARQVMAALSGDDRPVLVDSAGCGAAMKHYGRL
ncbi:MAG: (Fe-S)-binding protein, partial [Acidimicrobiia bacterium]|nr:(Fe-S)-binding protein [Acidimicrobiia bacterium]